MLYLFYITLAVNAHCHSSKCDGYNKDMQHVCRDLGHRSRLHYISGGPSYFDCPSGWATCKQDGWGSDWICDGRPHQRPIGTIYLKEGQQCGGPQDPYAMKRVCKYPLNCNVDDSSPNPDGFGTCEYPVKEVITTNYVGGPCGSGDSPSMHSYQCGSGLVCRGPPRGRQGSYGQCQQRYSPAPPSPSPPAPSGGQGQIGDMCGNGPVGFYRCQSGLECYNAVPPAYGTCRTPGFPNRRLEETKLDEAPGQLEAPQESRRRGSCFNKCGGFNKDMQHVCRDLGHRSRLHYISGGPSYFDCPSGWATCKQEGWSTAWICDGNTPPAQGQYEILESGSCIGRGLTPIPTIEACEQAGRSLGLGNEWPQETNQEYRPQGCYLYQGSQLWFADNAGTYGRGTETGNWQNTRQPICYTLPLGIGGGRRLDEGETEEQLVELQAPVAEVSQE